MKKTLAILVLAIGFLFMISKGASASTITHYATPSQVPDQQPPVVNYNDAPLGFGPDSWQNTQISGDKVNWHARYLADGDYLSVLFPTQAATLTINDIDSISYWTNRPSGTASGEDWATYIYTRPKSGGDSSWYGYRFINDYGTHTALNTWTQYSTDSGMQFMKNSGTNTGYMSLTNLKSNYGTELVMMFSVQTMTNYVDFDGYMDGLIITLVDGSVGKVDFVAPVPEPATMLLLGSGLVGLVGFGRKKLASKKG